MLTTYVPLARMIRLQHDTAAHDHSTSSVTMQADDFYS